MIAANGDMMPIKEINVACSAFVFVLIQATAFAQVYITPPVQSVPMQMPIEKSPIEQMQTQQLPVGQALIDNGIVIPAGASLPVDQIFPGGQVIPSIPGQQSAPITMAAAPIVELPWTQKLVENVQTFHDFGSVPTGSQQEHVFEFVNTSGATLNLISVKASCGCTKPTVVTTLVQPGETAKVKAKFDTMKFRGEKAATVTVGVNKLGAFSQYGEVQLSVKGKIRKDVVLTPGKISFDSVPATSAAEKTVKMKYAGNPLWQILRVESTNANIKAEARELKREGGRITYELIVKLSGLQPAGSFADELYVITNDKLVNKMPITVAGRVKPTLEAAPVRLGIVRQGAKIEKRFVIRGQRPFEVREVRVNSKLISFVPTTGEKSLHVLKYSLDTSTACFINDIITVVTSDPDNLEKTVEFSAQIVPETVTGN